MIEVKNLVKKYGDHLAVDHLNFTVEQGQIYGFLGPNGAGKSTTMNIMTGYLGATEGQILIAGYDILKEPEEAKKHIGYLPEIPPLYVDMTVDEYLTFSAELKRIEKDVLEEEVEKVIELVGLTEVRARLIKNLSKGYRQRVGLAQAVLGFPEIIILDEPMVGLDPKQIIEIRELIRELAREHTVILSSHILAEVQEICDHIMIISHGKLVASDTPKNLEKMMSRTELVHIQTRCGEEQVNQILETLENVEEWELVVEEEVVSVTVKANGTEDIREDLFRAFAKADCPLIMLQKETVSLEDVFLELTGETVEEIEEEIEEVMEEEETEDESDL